MHKILYIFILLVSFASHKDHTIFHRIAYYNGMQLKKTNIDQNRMNFRPDFKDEDA